MAINNTALTLAPANIYVCNVASTVVSTIYFCNYGAAAANLNVWLLSSGNSVAGTSGLIYREVQIAAADTLVIDKEKLVMTQGDMIKANSGGTVTACVNSLN
jgi:hypothetical protein